MEDVKSELEHKLFVCISPSGVMYFPRLRLRVMGEVGRGEIYFGGRIAGSATCGESKAAKVN